MMMGIATTSCGENPRLFAGGFPGKFISHGTVMELLMDYGVDPDSLAERITSAIGTGKGNKKRRG